MHDRVRVIRPQDCTEDVPSGPMTRQAAVSGATVGARGLWLGHVQLGPGELSAPHHHGNLESAIYVVSGSARFLAGEQLEEVLEAGPGDVVWVPPHTVHVEMNAATDAPLVVVVARSGQQNVTVNVDPPPGWAPPPR